VCPPNRAAELRRQRLGTPATGARVAVEVRRVRPSLVEIVLADDETLFKRFGHFYLAGRNVDLLRRNALVALGNVARGDDPEVGAALTAALASGQSMLRAHAVWAAGRLGRLDLLEGLEATEEDPEVQAELALTKGPRS
jgi:epoxyqueuosine reductase QueG